MASESSDLKAVENYLKFHKISTLDQIKKEIVENPKMDPDLAQKVEKAALEAEKLQSIGKERLANHASQLDQAGRDRLIKMLQQVETILKQDQTMKVMSQIPLCFKKMTIHSKTNNNRRT